MFDVYRMMIYNSSLITEYKGMYVAGNSFSVAHRNHMVAMFKLMELDEKEIIPDINIPNKCILEVNGENISDKVNAIKERSTNLNTVIIIKVNSENVYELISQKIPGGNIFVVDKSEMKHVNNLKKLYSNVVPYNYKENAMNVGDVTWEEYELIKYYYANDLNDNIIFFERDFKSRIYINTIEDVLRIDSFKPELFNVSTNRFRFEPFMYSVCNYGDKLEEVINTTNNLSAEDYPSYDMYLVDALNGVGYIPKDTLDKKGVTK